MFKKSIAIVKIGYNSFAIPDAEQAMELMRILGTAVRVTDSLYSVHKFTDCQYALEDNDGHPELKFIPESKIDGQNTVEEIKARGEREEKDRQDMKQQFTAAPPQLTAPGAPVAPPEMDATEEFF